MPIYYVGSGGNDGNDGLSWANRKLTLNGAEDIPVVAGDTVYVGPGIYREQLTCDVSGSSGQPITYIGDVTGYHTDGVGGKVSITTSADDKTPGASYAIYATSKTYRTFRGFDLYLSAGGGFYLIYITGTSDQFIFEDCVISLWQNYGIQVSVNTASIGMTIRRCVFIGGNGLTPVRLQCSSEVYQSHLIENCLFLFNYSADIVFSSSYGAVINNCTFIGGHGSLGRTAVQAAGVTTGNQIFVYNCVIDHKGMSASTTNVIIDDYNVYADTPGAMTNVSKGANTVDRAILWKPSLFVDGYMIPSEFPIFSPWSLVPGLACGQSPPSDDLFGITRPSSDSKKTRGCIQYSEPEYEATTVYGSEPTSLKLRDAMAHQIVVPVTGSTMRFTAQVYREANYAGTNPQMIIKQYGTYDHVATDAGSASQWNELSMAFKPNNSPPWLIVELRSNNTASSGSYETFFGGLLVK